MLRQFWQFGHPEKFKKVCAGAFNPLLRNHAPSAAFHAMTSILAHTYDSLPQLGVLVKLSDSSAKCEMIGAGLNQNRDYMARPSDAIHRGIEEVLSLFATKLRYYNLNHVAGAAQGQQDPVALWWEKVATSICDRHYSQRQREKDKADAVAIETIVGDITFVIHSTETGEPIQDVHLVD
jgi:hypothetical protein